MEAAGIEPASRDVSGQASTCVVDSLGFAPAAANRQASAGASRQQGLTWGVADATPGDPELVSGIRVLSGEGPRSRGYVLRSHCEVRLGN